MLLSLFITVCLFLCRNTENNVNWSQTPCASTHTWPLTQILTLILSLESCFHSRHQLLLTDSFVGLFTWLVFCNMHIVSP